MRVESYRSRLDTRLGDKSSAIPTILMGNVRKGALPVIVNAASSCVVRVSASPSALRLPSQRKAMPDTHLRIFVLQVLGY